MSTNPKSITAFGTTNPTFNITNPTCHIIKAVLMLLTPALFSALLVVWDISMEDFEVLINTSSAFLPEVLSHLNISEDASEALSCLWLVVNKKYGSYSTGGIIELVDVIQNVYTLKHYSAKYKHEHSLVTKNIKALHTVDTKTINSKKSMSLMRNLWAAVSRFLTFNSSNMRLKYKLVDRPLYRKKHTKKHNISFIIKSNHNTDYLDEETDEEEIQQRNTDEEEIHQRNIDEEEIHQRNFDKLFESSYAKDYYFEVVVPENNRRNAEADDEFLSDDTYEFTSDDDKYEWNTSFDNIERVSLQYN